MKRLLIVALVMLGLYGTTIGWGADWQCWDGSAWVSTHVLEQVPGAPVPFVVSRGFISSSQDAPRNFPDVSARKNLDGVRPGYFPSHCS